jgi:membrane-associated PAP2 superfamily phosphatase
MRAFAPPGPALSRPTITATLPAVADATSAGRLPRWVAWQALVPLASLAVATICLIPLGGDRWIADHVYAAEGGRWALRNSYLLTRVLHAGGKALSTLAWLSLLALALRATMGVRWKPLRRPLLVLLLSVAASTLVVSVLKHVTRMDCPWDAAVYGGMHPYFTLLQARPAGIRPSGCFPAGQASAGYAWVALYFFCASVRPAWRRIGLAVGIGAGLVLGIAQQLRGAHYLSHDLWTLAICWFVALGLHRLSLRRVPDAAAPVATAADETA